MNFKTVTNRFLDFGIFAVIFSVITLCGCSKPRTENRPASSLEDPIFEERIAKDGDFKRDKESPISDQNKPAFHGIAYYPVNPDLRFTVKLRRYSNPKQIRLATNTGEIRRGLRYGCFEFQVGGQACQLQVYRLEDSTGGEASLFIPFRDSTSGQETYAAGRYIDLKENISGIYDLDFNRAYNPYCAYNSRYSCPVPPPENTLKVPIRAGEKKYFPGTQH